MRVLILSESSSLRVSAAIRLNRPENRRCTFEASTLPEIEAFSGTSPDGGTAIVLVGDNLQETAMHLREIGVSLPLVALIPTPDSTTVAKLLDIGCDDAVSETTDPVEITARIRAVCRRATMQTSVSTTIGRMIFHADGREPEIDGKPVKLSRIEFAILETLARRPGTVVARETLFENVWPDSNKQPYDKVLDVHMFNLRKKLSAASQGENFVSTVPSRGYILDGR